MQTWCSAYANVRAWPVGKTVKDGCLAELAEFQADLTTNVNKDIPLGEWLHVSNVHRASP